MSPQRLFNPWIFVAVIIGGAIVTSVAFGAGVWMLVQNINENARTTRALCAFRADLEQRADSAEKFLAEHPGDLFFGRIRIPRVQLVVQVQNQKATLHALDNLNC